LSIRIEKPDFHKQSDILRVSGTIIEGPDDVPKGSHHTFNVEMNSVVTIIKEKWLEYQKEKLNEATAEQPKILMVVFDRDEAHFAYAKSYGYEYLSEIKSDLPKKEDETKVEGHYYQNIIKQISDYAIRYKIERIIVASPAFWKEYLMKEIKDLELKKKIIYAMCSSADKGAFEEVLKRPEVETALKESKAAEEINLVDELLKEIMKNNLAKYGFDEVNKAVDSGAVKILLITDFYINDAKEKGEFEKIDLLLKKVDLTKGKIKIISSDNSGGKKLDGLGGVAALLRYKFE